MTKKAIFTLPVDGVEQFFVYEEDDEGNAIGEALTEGKATLPEAQAELAKLDKATPPPAKPTKAKAVNTADDERVTGLEIQVKALQIALAAKGNVTGVRDNEAEKPFKSLAEQLGVVIYAGQHPGETPDKRLLKLNEDYAKSLKATGLNEATANEGGFLLQPTITQEVLMPMRTPETSPFGARARRLPVGTNSNSGWINAVNETSRATGSRWGGVQGYRLAEGATKTPSKPDFRRINWELKKYAVVTYATDELLQDTTQLAGIVTQAGGEELTFMLNDDILNGSGVAGPLGMLSATALVTQAKETGQAAATVTNANIIKMWQRLHPRARANAVWFINSEVEPQLDALYLPVGAAGLEPRYVTYSADGVMKIKGKPVVVTEFNAALGTVGDIVLADMSEYLMWDRAPETATSIHIAFLTDETAIRMVYRVDGKPSLASPITPYKATSGQTQSTMVALATRS